jgi:hypothetical protein
MPGIDDGSKAVLRWSTPKIFAVGDDRPVDTHVRWSFSSHLAAMLLEEEPANWERAVPVYNSTISLTQNEAKVSGQTSSKLQQGDLPHRKSTGVQGFEQILLAGVPVVVPL